MLAVRVVLLLLENEALRRRLRRRIACCAVLSWWFRLLSLPCCCVFPRATTKNVARSGFPSRPEQSSPLSRRRRCKSTSVWPAKSPNGRVGPKPKQSSTTRKYAVSSPTSCSMLACGIRWLSVQQHHQVTVTCLTIDSCDKDRKYPKK